nr:response regulator [Candidatus Dadabacteria bacterium]NIQ16468.1 response regulator [Candidatus Dadabacteria bacterium]
MDKILLIDDEPGIRESLGITLQMEGYNVKVADNGLSALSIIQQKDDFNFIICDMKMPE